MKPNAIIDEKLTPSMTSGRRWALSETGPRIRATAVEKPVAHKSGSNDTIRPNAAPANAACDIVNPIDERFIRTTKTPTIEHTAPASIEASDEINRNVGGN